MTAAWVFQDHRQLEAVGPERASWFVRWRAEGARKSKSFGPGERGRRRAEKFQLLIDDETSGLFGALPWPAAAKGADWDQFRAEYRERILDGLARPTWLLAEGALDRFQRCARPKNVGKITTQDIDDFIAARRAARLAPSTINKDLAHLKAALSVAVEWKYLAELPHFRFERVPRKLARTISDGHFAALYQSCGQARWPRLRMADCGLRIENQDPLADAGSWWRGLLVMGYMTGWRVEDMLALRRDQLDFATGIAVSLAEDNKGKRDERVQLHALVLEHLRALPALGPYIFGDVSSRQSGLYREFCRLQRRAGIELHCVRQHEHSGRCDRYGFHDLRRSFATANSGLSADVLQALMRHKSYQTTKLYIDDSRQVSEAVGQLHVPEVLQRPEAG